LRRNPGFVAGNLPDYTASGYIRATDCNLDFGGPCRNDGLIQQYWPPHAHQFNIKPLVRSLFAGAKVPIAFCPIIHIYVDNPVFISAF